MTPPRNELVNVYIAAGQMEAAIVQGRLQAADIPSLLAYESVGQVYGFSLNSLGQVQVKVPAAFAPQAQELLASTEDPL